jgi:hypothetical protein
MTSEHPADGGKSADREEQRVRDALMPLLNLPRDHRRDEVQANRGELMATPPVSDTATG